MSLQENAASGIWLNYIDMDADVKPYLQMPATDVTRDLVLQLVTDFVCQYSQQILGKPIAPTPFDRRFDGNNGWNGATIMLPYYPVLEVISVTEYWGFSGPHVLYEQTPTNQVDGFQLEYRTGRMTRVFPGLVAKPWFPGQRSIEIQWVAGHNPVPATFKLAALELVAWWWRNTQQAMRSAGPQPLGMEYDMAEPNTGVWEGLPHRIESVFSAYQQVGMG